MGLAESPVDSPDIQVELAVGLAPREVRLIRLSLPAGSTVRDALVCSGLLQSVPGLDEAALAAGRWSVGVWGRRERPGHVLRHRDRIELVRGLNVDPKEARRIRYRAQGEKLPKGIQRPKAPKG
ncbi:MAG: RnfH family protein [Burkholderiales bacterium]|nr:RnfH family protein [Burkholderiales bacterium]MBH2017182.1 RnfH family protein [Burkholderiales bacterium]